MADEAIIRFLLEGGEEPSAPAPVQPQRPTQAYPTEREQRQRFSRLEKPPDLFGDFKQAMRPAMRGVVGQLVSAGLDLVNALNQITQKSKQIPQVPVLKEVSPHISRLAGAAKEHAPMLEEFKPPYRAPEDEGPRMAGVEPTIEDRRPAPIAHPFHPMAARARGAEGEKKETQLAGPARKTQLNRPEPPRSLNPMIERGRMAQLQEPELPAPKLAAPAAPKPAGPQQLKATNVGAGSAEGATELEALTPELGESLAAAAPMVGAIVAIAVIVNQAMLKVRDGMVGAVGAVGKFAGYLASADTKIATPIENTGEGMKMVGDKLWALNPALSTMTMMTGEAVKQFGALTRELDGTTQRYKQYSPQLAVSDAMRDVRIRLGDLRRAQVVGPNLAKYNDSVSRLENQVEDIKVALLTQLLPSVTAAADGISDVVTGIEGMLTLTEAIAAHPFDAKANAAALLVGLDNLHKKNSDADKWEKMLRDLAVVQPIDIGKLANLAGAFRAGAEGGV